MIPTGNGKLDTRFSSPGAEPASWPLTLKILDSSEIYWLATVDRDGPPHVTPLIAVLVDGSLHFSTGDAEQKARNIERNPRCTLTTGNNKLNEGTDVVIRGQAVRVIDRDRLAKVAEAYQAKYGWNFAVGEGTLVQENTPHPAIVFEVCAATVHAFAKGEPFGQTGWRIDSAGTV